MVNGNERAAGLNFARVMGFPVCTESIESCVARIVKWVETGSRPRYFACANPHSIEVASKDPLFEVSLKKADLLVPDGIGLVWISRLLGIPMRERITGSDIFLSLSDALNRGNNHSYFFLGSSESTLNRITDRMQRDYPSIRVAGTYSPPFVREFSEDDIRLMVDAINEAKPDVLWVGMTAPKQEKWIYLNKDKLDTRFIGAIGAVFDFFAGTVKRPHPWFLKHGLEWLPRLLGEPRRLWRRTLISTPSFLLHALLYRSQSDK